MAMIQCPKCGEWISDQSGQCIQCGYVLSPQMNDQGKCPKCGAEIQEGMRFCSRCGCPLLAPNYPNGDDQPQQPVPPQYQQSVPPQYQQVPPPFEQPKRKFKTKYLVIILIAAVVLIAGVVAAVLGVQYVQEQNRLKLEEESRQYAEEVRKQYADNLNRTVNTMLLGASQSEDAGNLIKQVWYNSIYEEEDETTDPYTKPDGYFLEDFNDALNNLFSDYDFNITLDTIERNQAEVDALMKQMSDPPEEYEEAYEDLKELYDAYLELTNMVINPVGSLKTFSEDFNDADTETAKCLSRMQMYLEE